MANHKSAEKFHRQSLKKRSRNRSRMTGIKTISKSLLSLIARNDRDELKVVFPKFQSKIMQGAKKKVLNIKNASRKISRMSSKIKELFSSNVNSL